MPSKTARVTNETIRRRRRVRMRELKQEAIEALPLDWKVTTNELDANGTPRAEVFPIYLNADVGPFHLHVTVMGERDFDPAAWYFLRRRRTDVEGFDHHETLHAALSNLKSLLITQMPKLIEAIGTSVVHDLRDPFDEDEERTADAPYDYTADDLAFDAARERAYR